jgi:uncharacterized protein YjbI with pentapeptide repeats
MKLIILGILAFIFSIGLAFSTASAFNEEDLRKLRTTKQCAGCDLSYAELQGANLSNADLTGANLYGANLSGADLSYADLSNADVSAADLTGTNLSEATWIDGSWCRQGSNESCNR